MRLLVCGGRTFKDKNTLNYYLDSHNITAGPITVLIHGGAKGADTLAGEWAEANNIPVEIYPAKWNLYGKKAGYLRNKQMLEEGKPDRVVAFQGGPGTANMIRLAVANGVPVWDHSKR